MEKRRDFSFRHFYLGCALAVGPRGRGILGWHLQTKGSGRKDGGRRSPASSGRDDGLRLWRRCVGRRVRRLGDLDHPGGCGGNVGCWGVIAWRRRRRVWCGVWVLVGAFHPLDEQLSAADGRQGRRRRASGGQRHHKVSPGTLLLFLLLFIKSETRFVIWEMWGRSSVVVSSNQMTMSQWLQQTKGRLNDDHSNNKSSWWLPDRFTGRREKTKSDRRSLDLVQLILSRDTGCKRDRKMINWSFRTRSMLSLNLTMITCHRESRLKFNKISSLHQIIFLIERIGPKDKKRKHSTTEK